MHLYRCQYSFDLQQKEMHVKYESNYYVISKFGEKHISELNRS